MAEAEPEQVAVPRGKDPTLLNPACSNDQRAERYYNAALLVGAGQVAKFEDGSCWRDRELLLKAIEFQPTLAPAYGNLALLLKADEKIELSGVEWGPQQLYVRAIELEPNFPIFYVNLSALLGSADKVAFHDGATMDRLQLLVRAITVDPKCAMAYANLGVVLPAGSKIQLSDGLERTKEELLELARSIDPKAVPLQP